MKSIEEFTEQVYRYELVYMFQFVHLCRDLFQAKSQRLSRTGPVGMINYRGFVDCFGKTTNNGLGKRHQLNLAQASPGIRLETNSIESNSWIPHSFNSVERAKTNGEWLAIDSACIRLLRNACVRTRIQGRILAWSS